MTDGDGATTVGGDGVERRWPGRPPIVTMDGPAGSGKSTTAKEVAARLGFRHLDSGALYRALTHALLDRGVPREAWSGLAVDDFHDLGIGVDTDRPVFTVLVDGTPGGDELRTAEVTEAVSYLASLPGARACLLGLQRRAGEGGGLVADGRDMGTVVYPDAEVKVFVVADLMERARRRLLEEGAQDPDEAEVAAAAATLGERDQRDSRREISPLRPPEDAHRIDTTELSFDEQVGTIVGLVEALTLP